MRSKGGQEPPTPPDRPDDYAPGDRISAGICSLVLLAVGALLADIASNGRLLRRFSGSPAAEAERITREAVT
jgi:hypothetical protein